LPKYSIAFFLGCAALISTNAFAQTPPDDLKVTAADLVFEASEKHTEEFHKYFYFHKEGVSFETARNEIGECHVYQDGPVGGEGEVVAIVPRFVSLSENQSYKPYVYNDQGGGVVGAIIGGMIAGPILQKNRAQRYRKCMEYKGYDRYGISKDLWKTFSKGVPGDDLIMQASIASGPKPKTEKILP